MLLKLWLCALDAGTIHSGAHTLAPPKGQIQAGLGRRAPCSYHGTELEPTHPGHMQIRQDCVERPARPSVVRDRAEELQLREGFLATGCGLHLRVANMSKQARAARRESGETKIPTDQSWPRLPQARIQKSTIGQFCWRAPERLQAGHLSRYACSARPLFCGCPTGAPVRYAHAERPV